MNADRSVLVGVQELLPRRQAPALCAGRACPERAVERYGVFVRDPFLWACERSTARSGQSTTAIAPARVYPRPILLLFTGVQFSFMNNSG